jgi:hypothetical protein
MDRLTDEVLRMAKLGWILEKIGKNFRQYFNIKNPQQHTTVVEAENDPTVIFYVGGNNDDAYEQGTGTFYLTDYYVYIQSYTDPASASYVCGGFRFPNVTIPQGSTINAASFSGYISSITYDDANTKIYGNDVDNAEDFNTNPHIIPTANRPRTDAYVSWVADTIGTGWKTKAGLESIIQEIVNRGGWVSGNPIVLLFIANTDTTKKLRFYSYEYGSAYAAKLEITWTGGVAHSKTIAEKVGFVDGHSKAQHHKKTVSEKMGFVDEHDKDKCKECEPSSVVLTF